MTERERPMILAPVGGREQLIAAVRCGADAVYFGAKGFNARRNADNFEGFDFSDAVAMCRENGVRVFVTLNTLVTDGETDGLIKTVDEIAAAGPDAVIVQDPAAALTVRSRYPELPLHASTQMAVHNAEGVRVMERLGFEQVVLARELSLKEIRSIRSETSVRLEAFVHGARCFSLSGGCYLSSVIGTRSGNRGLCAQPCRMNFLCGGKEYALSLKDLCAIPDIHVLAAAGVSTLKIEGRMKRPEYVAAAVSACRAQLDGEEPDLEGLRAVFSRSGFTNAYLTGERNAKMFGIRTKEDVAASSGVLRKYAALYANETQRIPLTAAARVLPDAPAELTVSDGVRTVTVKGPVPEPAVSVSLTEEALRKNVIQTGGTPYRIASFSAETGEGLSLPVSAQKALRRDALKALSDLRREREPYEKREQSPTVMEEHAFKEHPEIRMMFSSVGQIPEACEAEKLLLPAEEIVRHPDCVNQYGERLTAVLPGLCFPEDMPGLKAELKRLRALGIEEVFADNTGLCALALENGFRVHGGAQLNVLNSVALEEYRRMGLCDTEVSFELSMKKIAALKGGMRRGIRAYGYLPLMRTRACPAFGKDGCLHCGGNLLLTDEKRERFRMLCRGEKYRELLNSVPLYIGDKRIRGADFVTLGFTVETKEEAAHVIRLFLAGAEPDFRRTTGLYFRELQ